MSDELPPAPSESTEDATKAETIRITLPPKPDQPTAKRETVRINLPGKPASTPGASSAPKKETTKIPPASEAATISAPPAGAGKPFVPPPPKPPSPVGSGAMKPMSGVNPPPKPPSLGAKPTVPLKPTPPPASVAKPASGSNPAVEPVTQRAAAPKKETARITLPPESGKPALPKATVKMQQTQPLVKQPAASVTSASSLQPVPTLGTAAVGAAAEAEPDGMVNILSIAALLISLISLGLVFWAYSASSVS
ncbi:hypothetical protein CfE428DRAFT_2472 [Chthoniobacter flavus Ellin428]|uniref:Uncharacterized protein n=1 Tax=Chthoniobacter flavus Ellin428 TaxID=497964 RepID=B4D0M1_9BACT|nr:hypothetical protein [Chthoniobacter flavus]EDY19883.1 hypothetical protein CfE428DRAFT_2472 [Chthoniobacter flavus Ellin428]TCO91846.1 hypothetical protein EV701_107127 [Chthoniobacter flavus]